MTIASTVNCDPQDGDFFQVRLAGHLCFNQKRETSEVRKMGSVRFTEQEMKQLKTNPNVRHVTEKSITYSPAFKLASVKAYEEGQKPMEIFLIAGFDMDVIGHKIPQISLKRWRYAYTANGESGLLEDRRGKGTGLYFKRESASMKAISEIETQRKELNSHIKNLFKTGELEITDADIDKTLFLLELNPSITNLIEDYEFSQEQMTNGMTLYQLMNAEGNARYGEHGQELQKDVTADSVVLDHKSQAIYQVYKSISSIIHKVVNNLKDDHERKILHMLFIEGKIAVDAVQYMESGYANLRPIFPTTFWDKRRGALKKVAASLKMAGVLELVGEKNDSDSKSLNKPTRSRRQYVNMRFRLVFTEWDTLYSI
jgi:transposase